MPSSTPSTAPSAGRHAACVPYLVARRPAGALETPMQRQRWTPLSPRRLANKSSLRARIRRTAAAVRVKGAKHWHTSQISNLITQTVSKGNVHRPSQKPQFPFWGNSSFLWWGLMSIQCYNAGTIQGGELKGRGRQLATACCLPHQCHSKPASGGWHSRHWSPTSPPQGWPASGTARRDGLLVGQPPQNNKQTLDNI